jgi:hypothetical protein
VRGAESNLEILATDVCAWFVVYLLVTTTWESCSKTIVFSCRWQNVCRYLLLDKELSLAELFLYQRRIGVLFDGSLLYLRRELCRRETVAQHGVSGPDLNLRCRLTLCCYRAVGMYCRLRVEQFVGWLFQPWLFNSWEKTSDIYWIGILVGALSRSETFWRPEKSLLLPEIERRSLCCVARTLVAVLNYQSRLLGFRA